MELLGALLEAQRRLVAPLLPAQQPQHPSLTRELRLQCLVAADARVVARALERGLGGLGAPLQLRDLCKRNPQ